MLETSLLIDMAIIILVSSLNFCSIQSPLRGSHLRPLCLSPRTHTDPLRQLALPVFLAHLLMSVPPLASVTGPDQPHIQWRVTIRKRLHDLVPSASAREML